jgi:hypothetical protein
LTTIELVAPRISLIPESDSFDLGREAVEFNREVAHVVLDPWEEFVLERSLGETAGNWSASEVGMVVPRQNGKDAVLVARELAGLFWFKEELILHSAHHFKTAQEHFRRLVSVIENSDELRRRVKRISRSHGEEGIELLGGQWIRFFARTKGGGRGFSAPLVIFNEAMMLPEEALGALLPTQAAMPRRQRWFAGSAVDQMVHEHGTVLARVRERGIAGEDPRLAYFEWSLEAGSPEEIGDEAAADESAWAASNPGLDIRITRDAVADELRSLDRRTFCVERLGVGDWPVTNGEADGPIGREAWDALVDMESLLLDPVCIAFDVSPDRAWCSVAAAGRNRQGLFHVEIMDHRRGTGWVVGRLVELFEHQPETVVCDGYGPAASLLQALDEAGVAVTTVTSSEHGRSCGRLVDMVAADELRHLGSDDLRAAVRGARTRPLGDAFAWSRKHSAVDISPLVAATLALGAAAAISYDNLDLAIF